MRGVPSSRELATECDNVPVLVTYFATYSFDSQELAVRYAFFAILRVCRVIQQVVVGICGFAI